MANRTDPLASLVHGTNPQNLIENIVKQRIYEQLYWKEECFALTPESLLEKAVELRCVGGTHGGQRQATKFLCLVLKLLQLQPDKEIVYEYIANEDFKYVRLLGAFYLRLVGNAKEIYQYLEPLYHDFRKLRKVNESGTFGLVHVDEAVHEMLTATSMFDTTLPRLPYRHTLVSVGRLKPRVSALDKEFESGMKKELERKLEEAKKRREAREEEEEEERRRAGFGVGPGRGPSSAHGGAHWKPKPRDHGRGASFNGDDDGAHNRDGGNAKRQWHRDTGSRQPEESKPKYRKTGGERSGRSGKERGGPASEKEDLAIQEANALRAKLGLKPLKM